jgi:hypothetical protein
MPLTMSQFHSFHRIFWSLLLENDVVRSHFLSKTHPISPVLLGSKPVLRSRFPLFQPVFRRNCRLLDAIRFLAPQCGFPALGYLEGVTPLWCEVSVRPIPSSSTFAVELQNLNRHVEAIADFDRALALDWGPGAPMLRQQRVISLAHAGHRDRATAEIETLIDGNDVPGYVFYRAANVYAVVLDSWKGENHQKEQFGTKAVAMVRRAHSAGYFRYSEDMSGFKTNRDFDPLREREDFKQLLADLNAAQSPSMESKPHKKK